MELLIHTICSSKAFILQINLPYANLLQPIKNNVMLYLTEISPYHLDVTVSACTALCFWSCPEPQGGGLCGTRRDFYGREWQESTLCTHLMLFPSGTSVLSPSLSQNCIIPFCVKSHAYLFAHCSTGGPCLHISQMPLVTSHVLNRCTRTRCQMHIHLPSYRICLWQINKEYLFNKISQAIIRYCNIIWKQRHTDTPTQIKAYFPSRIMIKKNPSLRCTLH